MVDFIDHESDIVNWESEPDHKHAMEEMQVIYKWWKDYPRRQDEISAMLTAWSNRVEKVVKDDNLPGFLSYLNRSEKDAEEKKFSAELDKLESKLIEEEQDMLRRLVDIRGFLWS